MIITPQHLIGAGIAPTQAKQFAEPLSAACAEYHINTPVRAAAFVAQCAHESLNFTRLEEGLWYRTPERIRAIWPARVPSLADAARLVGQPQALANRVYASRNGNGDESSGDGWRFRGRGLIQLTGRANYRKATRTPARDYEAHPELLTQPADACMTAAWFWASTGCNDLADGSQIDAITRTINGPALAGAADRRENFREALAALSSSPVQTA